VLLSDLIKVVDELETLADELCEFSSPSIIEGRNSQCLEQLSDKDSFLSSLFTSSKYSKDIIMSHVETIKVYIRKVKGKLSPASILSLSDYRSLVSRLDSNLNFIKASLTAAKPDVSVQASVDHYKEVESVAIAYKSLILQFNSCVVSYNALHPDQEDLSPFASTDISMF
jgi:hypothetical protein